MMASAAAWCMLIVLPGVHLKHRVCMYELKGLALSRASHSGEITLSGLRSLRPTPVLFAHAGCLSSQKQYIHHPCIAKTAIHGFPE